MESVPPHPNRSGKFQGSTSNIQKSAKMQYSKVSRGCEFLVRRLEIGEPVGQGYGPNRYQETSLSMISGHKSRSRWHKARDPNPKPRLVTCGLDAARTRKDSSRAR